MLCSAGGACGGGAVLGCADIILKIYSSCFVLGCIRYLAR